MRNQPNILRLLNALIVGFMVAASSTPLAAQESMGSVSGRVLTETGRTFIEGARIQLTEARREAASSRDGSYAFQNVPSGNYTLVISYAGFETETTPVVVTEGTVTRLTSELKLSALELESFSVVSRAEGQAEAVNLQRTAPTLRTVVSSDALGQIREGNIGDALVRLPGVSVETRAGVQRTATIRGLAPQFNTVTVDGLRMTNVDGNRDIALDSFPSNMLSRVEVIKAATPDLPSDAIGGVVNLVTRSAFDQDRRIFTAEIGTTFNDNRDTWNKQGMITYGDTFGSNRQFGLLGSIAYFQDNRGYDVMNAGYSLIVNPDTGETDFILNRVLYYDRNEKKDKVGAGLSFDWRPSDAHQLFVRALYHYDFRELDRRGVDYRPNTAGLTSQSPTAATATGSRIDAVSFYREPKNVFQMYSAGGVSKWDAWVADYRIAYSKAKKTYPETLQILNSFNGLTLTYDRTDARFPSFSVENNVDLTDSSGLAFRQYQTNQVPRTESEWSFDASVARAFATHFPLTVKTGLRSTLKDASQSQPDTVRYNGLAAGNNVQDLLRDVNSPDFMSKSNGRAVLLGFAPDWKAYRALEKQEQLTQNAASVLYTEQTRAQSDFSISEDIHAAFLMGTMDINQLQLLAGVRYEKTEVSGEANKVTVGGNPVAVQGVERVSGGSSYSNVLPGVHARYLALNDQLIIRAAYTQSISRPAPGDLVPSVQENTQMNQRIIGNPALKPATSDNFDLSIEYYYPRLGLVSAGVFHKKIDDFVFNSSRIANDNVDERTKVNGEGGKVTGLEFVWQQNFDFLPEPFNGLGLETNVTFLNTEAEYPNRPGEDLPLTIAPDKVINIIGSYAKGPFSVRISYNRLDERLESVGNNRNLDLYNAKSSVWDAAFTYNINKNGSFFLNVKNLNNEPTVQFQGSAENPRSVVYYGTQYNLGFKFEL